MAGFGPANTGVKVLCLRPAWRHLRIWWIGDYGHPSGPLYELYHLSHAVQYEGYWVRFFISQPVFTGSQRPYHNLFFTSSETVVNLAAILLVILPLIACKLISISTPRRTWTFNLRLLQYLTCRYWRRAMLYPVELSEHVSGQGRIWTYELRRGLIYSQHALTTCIPVQNFRWFVRVPTSQWATTFALQGYLLLRFKCGPHCHTK